VPLLFVKVLGRDDKTASLAIQARDDKAVGNVR
jgi:hypothetical protein